MVEVFPRRFDSHMLCLTSPKIVISGSVQVRSVCLEVPAARTTTACGGIFSPPPHPI